MSRVGKIVDVAPVLRRGLRGRLALDHVLDQGAPSASGRAEDEEIEPVAANADGKLDRAERTLLAHGRREFRQLIHRLEGEVAEIAGAVEQLRRQRRTRAPA